MSAARFVLVLLALPAAAVLAGLALLALLPAVALAGLLTLVGKFAR